MMPFMITMYHPFTLPFKLDVVLHPKRVSMKRAPFLNHWILFIPLQAIVSLPYSSLPQSQSLTT